MNPPLVTVVVPAFNAETWISESLASITAQSYPRDCIDVIVVDDGSTDRTVDTAKDALHASGIAHTIVGNLSSTGPSAARNRGWRAGRGQWVQFLDADDRLHPTKIELQARAASTASTDVAALHSPWAQLILNEGRWTVGSTWTPREPGADPMIELLRADNFMQLGCLLFSRKWLERVNGFDETIRFVEDVDLLLRLMMSGAALAPVASAEPLSWYRQHPASLSKSDDRRLVDGCVRNARLVERHWRAGNELTPRRAAAIAAVYFGAARFLSSRDRDGFEKLVGDIYRLDPNFVPEGPRALRILTRLFGYPRAERCAVQYRRLKRSIRPQATA